MTVPDSIAEVEEFITENFPGDKAYFGQVRGKTFKFPPGHAAKLKNFISEIQSKNSVPHLVKSKNKGSSSSKPHSSPLLCLSLMLFM